MSICSLSICKLIKNSLRLYPWLLIGVSCEKHCTVCSVVSWDFFPLSALPGRTLWHNNLYNRSFQSLISRTLMYFGLACFYLDLEDPLDGKEIFNCRSASVLEKSREKVEALGGWSNTGSNFPEMLWNLHPWRHSEPNWIWLRATSSRRAYSEQVGLGELQRLLSTKIILFLSDFFFIPLTLSKIYSSSTKAVKEKKFIWGFVVLFVQAQNLVRINRYLLMWKKATGKLREKKTLEDPLMKVVQISELSQRLSKINCLKLSSQEWGGSGNECCVCYKW